ncbi:DUF6318 family protein [Dermabacteraceae bacterium P13077]
MTRLFSGRAARVIACAALAATSLTGCSLFTGEKAAPAKPATDGTVAVAGYDGKQPSGLNPSPGMLAPSPDLFPGMEQNTEAGAFKALEYWHYAYNYAMVTGDTSYARAITGPDCSFCGESLDDVVKHHRTRGYFTAAKLSFSNPEVVTQGDETRYVVDGAYEGRRYVDVAKGGEQEVAPYKFLIAARMEYRDGRWLVQAQDLGQIDPQDADKGEAPSQEEGPQEGAEK